MPGMIKRLIIERLIKWLRPLRTVDPYDGGWPDAERNSYGCWEVAVEELRKRQEAARK